MYFSFSSIQYLLVERHHSQCGSVKELQAALAERAQFPLSPMVKLTKKATKVKFDRGQLSSKELQTLWKPSGAATLKGTIPNVGH